VEESSQLPAVAALDSEFGPDHSRAALEAGEIGTWEWDLTTGNARWSAQMFRSLGLPYRCESDLFGVLLGATHPDDRQRLEAAWARFSGRPGPLRLELRMVWPTGEVRWIVFLGQVIADAAGRPVWMLGITIDSTRRRNSEEAAAAALRDSERRLREVNEKLEQLAEQRARQLDSSRAQIQAIFDNLPDWLTLFRATPDGCFVYEDLNRATERAYGRSREQVIGHRLEEVLGTEQAQLPLEHMRLHPHRRQSAHTARRSMAGVTRTIDVMFARVPEKHEGDALIMATARDITEREAVDQQLRHAQKMEAVGHLTGGIAHDFNNLMTAIIGNLELLERRLAGDETTARFLGGAQRAALHGARLTEQLLAFSRRQHLQPCAVDLNAVVDNMRDLLARTIGTTIQVRTKLTPDRGPRWSIRRRSRSLS
jgi:PAS domain S-box-containing protein